MREVNKVCGLHFFNPAPVMKLVEMGATTIWERWDSLRPDGSVNPGEMTSFNHYAFGAVADWLHPSIGGLAPAESGYRHLDIRQHPGGDLTHASARHLTPYGLAEIAWKIETGQIEVVVVVPPNATASVTLPGGVQHQLRLALERIAGRMHTMLRATIIHARSIARSASSLTILKPGGRC